MSRFTKELSVDKTACYGFDHATGYFFQVFGPDIDGEENLVVDECSMFTKMTNGRMVELMSTYEVDKEHILMAASDLPF